MNKLDMQEQSLLDLAIAKEKSFDEKIGYTGAAAIGADICCSRRILGMAEIPCSVGASGSGKTASRIAPDAGVTAKQEIDALTAVPDAVTTGVSAK